MSLSGSLKLLVERLLAVKRPFALLVSEALLLGVVSPRRRSRTRALLDRLWLKAGLSSMLALRPCDVDAVGDKDGEEAKTNL